MEDAKPLPKATPARIILIRELASGPKKWGQLVLAYYGQARADNGPTVSFWNKLKDCKTLGIIKHDVVQKIYELGEVGQAMLIVLKEQNVDLSAVKSEAQLEYEAKH